MFLELFELKLSSTRLDKKELKGASLKTFNVNGVNVKVNVKS